MMLILPNVNRTSETLTQKTWRYCWDAKLLLTKIPICQLQAAQQDDSIDERMNSRKVIQTSSQNKIALEIKL